MISVVHLSATMSSTRRVGHVAMKTLYAAGARRGDVDQRIGNRLRGDQQSLLTQIVCRATPSIRAQTRSLTLPARVCIGYDQSSTAMPLISTICWGWNSALTSSQVLVGECSPKKR